MAAVLLRALSRRTRRVVVRGESMRPTLQPGDELLVWRTTRGPRVGDLLAYRDRFSGRLRVKRVAAVPVGSAVVEGRELPTGEGYVVLGDNPVLSTDSRTEGAVPADRAVGVVLARLAPAGRRGWLRYARRP